MGNDARINAGQPLQILDNYNRPITEGCEVLVNPPAVTAIIHSIVPSLDPQHQRPMLRVRAIATYEWFLPKGMRITNLLRVMSAEEMLAAGRIQVAPEGDEAPPLTPVVPLIPRMD